MLHAVEINNAVTNKSSELDACDIINLIAYISVKSGKERKKLVLRTQIELCVHYYSLNLERLKIENFFPKK